MEEMVLEKSKKLCYFISMYDSHFRLTCHLGVNRLRIALRESFSTTVYIMALFPVVSGHSNPFHLLSSELLSISDFHLIKYTVKASNCSN